MTFFTTLCNKTNGTNRTKRTNEINKTKKKTNKTNKPKELTYTYQLSDTTSAFILSSQLKLQNYNKNMLIFPISEPLKPIKLIKPSVGAD